MDNTKLEKIEKGVDQIKVSLNKKMSALQNFLGSEKNALKFMSAVAHAVQTNPKLLECSAESNIGAFMECASLGMYPSNHSGDCYIIPYNDNKAGMQAQFQMGYRGFKTLAFRAGMLRIGSEIVFENDKFKEYKGTDPRIEHEPADGDRGKPIGAYAWAEISKGNTVFKYMRKPEIMAIKAMAPGGGKYGAWNEKKDPERWMWQKTAIKQMGKLLPTSDQVVSDQINRAIYLDNVSERGGYIKKEGEVVEVPFEAVDRIEEGQDKKEEMRKNKKDVDSVKQGE